MTASCTIWFATGVLCGAIGITALSLWITRGTR